MRRSNEAMDLISYEARYRKVKLRNVRDGFVGVKVFRERLGETTDAADVIYWDATGGIAGKTKSRQLPVEAIEIAAHEVRRMSSRIR